MTQQTTSGLLLKHQKEIIDVWEKRAIKEVNAARDLQSLVLRNSLQEFLKQLAEALSKPAEKTAGRLTQESRARGETISQHGISRAGAVGYVLHEVILEFHILRQVIFDVLEKQATLASKDRDIILDTIEQAVNDAAGGFSDTLKELQEHFAITLTHDLRGPLTISKAAAQMILRRPDRSEHVEKLAFQINESMSRLDQMIQDILNASKLKAGEKLPIEITEFDLDSLVQEVVDEFRISNPERFVVHAPEGVTGQWSYEGLRRVLQNLLTNSVKYGGPESPITVTLETMDEAVRITVHNFGNPIPPEKQKLLFESFRQLKESDGKPGWGLGLFLTKGIVEAHNGSVRAVSTPNAGTSFIVELPRSARALKAVS